MNFTMHIRTALALFVGALVLVLAACKHTSDTNDDPTASGQSSETGELFISMTDAPGDFTNYTVDVTSITLTKANGTEVDTLPQNTRIDFSQYVEMTEFLTATRITKGIYTKATLALDYSNAEIWVEDENGESFQVTDFRDDAGNTLSTLVVSVHLEDRNALPIASGIPAHLSVDFDLKASNSIEYDDSNQPYLVVQPVVIADVNPELDKPHRARGLLGEVDAANNMFNLVVRPFAHPFKNDTRFGVARVMTTSTTLFDIDGVQYMGSDGTVALDGLTQLSSVIVKGDFKLRDRVIVASEVFAGESVPGGSLDVVKGTVTRRDGNHLTVKGATLIRAGGSVVFNDEVAVTVSASTQVFRQGSTEVFSIDDISVGQRLRAFGTLTNATPTELVLDASNGRVRMFYSTIRGLVVDNTLNSQLTLDVGTINGRRLNLFDFSGTGNTPENDSDPDAYEISTGILDSGNIENGEAVKIIGFVTPFGSAPADFVATSLVDNGNIRSVLVSNWKPASPSALVDAENGLQLDLTDTRRLHHLSRNGGKLDLTTLENPVTLNAKDDGGFYVIVDGATRTLHTSFSSFKADILARQTGGKSIRHLQATGWFDDATSAYNVDRLKLLID